MSFGAFYAKTTDLGEFFTKMKLRVGIEIEYNSIEKKMTGAAGVFNF